jgi:hypothetical protein
MVGAGNDDADETWWIEFENGGRSITYRTEAEAWAVVMELQTPRAQRGLRYSRPTWLVSSRDLRFAIPNA